MAIRERDDRGDTGGAGGAGGAVGDSAWADALALNALAWILSDDGRAQRFVAVTGIMPDDLRARASEPAVLDAALGFLEAHEPDLFACARVLGVTPVELIAAHARLGR